MLTRTAFMARTPDTSPAFTPRVGNGHTDMTMNGNTAVNSMNIGQPGQDTEYRTYAVMNGHDGGSCMPPEHPPVPCDSINRR